MIERSPLTLRQLRTLTANLNADRVSNRKQGNQNLSYLEAWDVKAALIRVFGYGNFSADLIESEILDQREVPQSKGSGTNWKVTAKATVRLHIHQTGATYTEAAIAGSAQPDITEAMDMALKSAESDALKRAAIYLGTQFGLSLYNAGSTFDVIKVVMAPGQEWPAVSEEKARDEIERLEQIIHGESDRQTSGDTTTMSMGPEGSFVEGVTPEQRAKNLALFDRSVNMAEQRRLAAQAQDQGQFAAAEQPAEQVEPESPNQ